MAKRSTGVGNHGKITSHKTKKRLETKRLRLKELASRRNKTSK